MCVFCELLKKKVKPDLEAIRRLDLLGEKYKPLKRKEMIGLNSILSRTRRGNGKRLDGELVGTFKKNTE